MNANEIKREVEIVCVEFHKATTRKVLSHVIMVRRNKEEVKEYIGRNELKSDA
jgi:hypothetical protein